MTKYHLTAIFNALIKAESEQVAKEKFIEQGLTKSPFHLQEDSIEIEPLEGKED